MDRRTFLRTSTGLASAATLSGCLSSVFETRSAGEPPLVENRPDAVYYPTHVEGMEMAGMAPKGDYKFAVMYSYAHRFWNMDLNEPSKTPIEDDDSMHVMATVWDPETGTVLPDTGLSLELTQDGETVDEQVIYPMLSQPMGFHYGANFGVPGDGTYTTTVSVGGMDTRRTGSFRNRFDDPASAAIEFDYSEATKNEITYERFDQKAGEKGAVDPMDMKFPNSIAPAKGELPGTVVGEGRSGDGVFVATVLDEPPEGIQGAGPYLAVSARTPHNRMILPAMAMSGKLERGGTAVFDGSLAPTLDPDLNYHYGAAVDGVESGDALTLSVDTPPQVARHEGYETAFLNMPDVELSVP